MTLLRSLLYYITFSVATASATTMIQQKATAPDIKQIIQDAKNVFPNNTVDVHAFKVDWYNKLVAPEYQLPYKNDTIALQFITIPYVFDNAFIPFLCKNQTDAEKDSWKKFITHYMEKVKQELQGKFDLKIPSVDIMYSSDFISGHAKILVQTSGHVSGAAYYYQRMDVVPDPWPKNKKIYGVSIHPLYGGYMSMDAVVILRDIQSSEMKQKAPPNVIPTWAMRKELLTIYNNNWENPKWRDMVPVKRKYTDEHMKYDFVYGAERENYVKSLIAKHCKCKI